MNDEQERLLRELVAETGWWNAKFTAIQALAQVVLELAAKAKAAEPKPGLGMGASALAAAAARDRQHYGESFVERKKREQREANAKMRELVDSAALQTPVRDGTMFDRLVECADEHLLRLDKRVSRQGARQLVLDLLSILDDDPGHDVTADVVPVCADRDGAVRCFRGMIQAIRRGE